MYKKTAHANFKKQNKTEVQYPVHKLVDFNLELDAQI